MGSGGGLIGTAQDPSTMDLSAPVDLSAFPDLSSLGVDTTQFGPGISDGGASPAGMSLQQIITGVGGAVGGVVGSEAGPIGGAVGAAAGAGVGGMLDRYFASGPGGRAPRAKHLNRSTYYAKNSFGVVARVNKGSKLVTNRRRNAGNAKAVRRALGRLAMFDHLANKVGAEMARVARRHHHAPRRALVVRSGHKPGCRCFACRRS